MIRAFDYIPQYESHREELDGAVKRVLASGQLILGPEVRAFEEEFADYVGASHGVAVASGTDAIILALRVLEIGPGHEVITVANAGAPPIAAIRAAGATPRLVDVDPETLLLDTTRLEEAMNERVRAIVPVHLYGQPVDLTSVLAFAAAHNLLVVEDCSQAHGARYQGQHVGRQSAVGCFSLYPTKNLGAFGDGGICVTGDGELAERLRMHRMYGFRDDGHAHCEGLNSRLDEMQAAILRVKLRYLDAAVAARREIATRYRDGLKGTAFRHPAHTPGGDHAYHLFVVEAPDRRHVCDFLDEREIGFGIHYPMAVHEMEAYGFLSRPGRLDVSERASRHVLSLPLYPGLSFGAVDRVIETLHEFEVGAGAIG